MNQKELTEKFGRKYFLEHLQQPLMKHEHLESALNDAKAVVRVAKAQVVTLGETVGNLESQVAISKRELAELVQSA